jgi:aryl-alcohol dehydrogenase-like predicted oxidoreductase
MPYFSLAAGFLTGKYRSADDIGGQARAGAVGGYASDRGFATVDALVDIAGAHGVAPASVALAWLASRPTVVAPIASARSVEQLPDLLASITLELTVEDLARLDAVSAPDGERTLS